LVLGGQIFIPLINIKQQWLNPESTHTNTESNIHHAYNTSSSAYRASIFYQRQWRKETLVVAVHDNYLSALVASFFFSFVLGKQRLGREI